MGQGADDRAMTHESREDEALAAAHAAEPVQLITDTVLVEALSELRAAKRKYELALLRAPPERFEPAVKRSSRYPSIYGMCFLH